MLNLHLGTRERQVFQILYELERDKASSQIRNYAIFRQLNPFNPFFLISFDLDIPEHEHVVLVMLIVLYPEQDALPGFRTWL